MDRNRLVAHRGYPSRYPENTLIGIEAALRLGARRLEVDVQLTADGEPVLFHDRDLRRICGVRGAVHERKLGELRELRASDPGTFGGTYVDTPVAMLSELVELLARFEDTETFVEIKPVAVETFGADTVVTAILERLGGPAFRWVLISFLPEALRSARRLGQERVGLILESWNDSAGPVVDETRPGDVLCNVRKLPWRGNLSQPGVRLAVYDIVDPHKARKLFDRGVDLVETFAIGEMLEHAE